MNWFKILQITKKDFFPLTLAHSVQQCLGSFNMLLVEESSEIGFFRKLSNNVFWSPYLRKYISYEGHIFFENILNLH